MPLVEIKLIEGRPVEKMEQLIVNVTETVATTLDTPKDRVRVVITEVPKTHWGIGGVSAKTLGR